MRIRWSLAALIVTAPLAAQTHQAVHPNPKALVDSAIAAMGGRDRLTGLTALRLDGMQMEYVLGNAERAEGPWRTQYTRFSELWDVAHGQLRRTFNATGSALGTASDQVWILTDSVMALQAKSRVTAAYGGFMEDLKDRVNGSPARVLLAAAAAPSLKWDREVTRFGIAHDVVSYRTPEGWSRVELPRTSHLPVAVEIVRHPKLDVRRSMFGDVTMRIEYEDWNSQPNGLWWPMQHRFFFNGELFRDLSLSRVDQLAVVAPDSFDVADSTRAAFSKAKLYFQLGSRPEPVQPGDDIVRLADNWAMTLIKQSDGVLIVEAHLSDQYIKQVIAEVHRRWPGAPIKGFILTSDPWAHLGGVREVIAQGYPIYVNGGSIPFLKALALRPFTLDPDDLAKAPKPAKFIPINGKISLGTGKNRVDLYPVGGAYSERMTMAYFPERKLLYGADLVFPDRSPPATPGGAPPAKTFFRTSAIELIHAVAREKLQVDSMFCVQASYPVFAWKDFVPTGVKP